MKCKRCNKQFKKGQLKFRIRHPIKTELQDFYCYKCYIRVYKRIRRVINTSTSGLSVYI